MTDDNQTDITSLTVQLLSAFVSNNNVASENLPELIRATRAALFDDLKTKPDTPDAPSHVGAVSARKSLASPEHILSMIDGKPYKTLTRHLSANGLTPAEYRERYKLPANYPMVAPAYSAQRRAVAARLGLGRRVQGASEADAGPATPVAELEAQSADAVATTVTKAPAKSGAKKNAPAISRKSAKKATVQQADSSAVKAKQPKKGKATMVEAIESPLPAASAAVPPAKPRKRLSIAVSGDAGKSSAEDMAMPAKVVPPVDAEPQPQLPAAEEAKPAKAARRSTSPKHTDKVEPSSAKTVRTRQGRRASTAAASKAAQSAEPTG
ncbi:MucR family transcriptional regulator [Sphingobium sp. BHU LFT2]|uniref:MucR family transcriptional regulator n=1 Tax=Sphingobium sp. BHU LFT2 TaxID=2807634 RepID=UPI001BE9CB88|nr:MucR family transcriptional regulator [Sphingobium sp. BHU LFT2]MBT2246359.1 MucR family transcriptional regulator [Sphingobium sp. BHU LFT2]